LSACRDARTSRSADKWTSGRVDGVDRRSRVLTGTVQEDQQ
jgi:hypothetical protein